MGLEPAEHWNQSTNHRQSQAAKVPFCAPLSSRGNMLLLLALLLLSYGAGNVNCSTIRANITDILPLLRFKRSINDPTGALRSWNRSIHYCQWNGVMCGSRTNPGRVVALNLAGQSLSGEITPSLGNITFLRLLNLSSNSFSGQIPPLNQFHELLLLDLSSNLLQGLIPDSITNCSNLKSLVLSRNKLEGPIPAKIGSLYNLFGLDLSRNNLTGRIPPTISNATQLKLLVLRDNQLDGSIPIELGQFSNMTGLDIGINMLSGRIPLSIFNLTMLQQLGLYANRLEIRALPLDIGDTLPNLIALTIGRNRLEGPIPPSLGNISGLLLLDLSSNSFAGELPSFGKLLNLQDLNLGNNKLESSEGERWESLYGLTNCSQLQTLILYKNQLKGAIPISVSKLSTKLERLHMGGNNLSGIIPSSLGGLGSIIDLDLSRNNFAGTIEGWVESLQLLQYLDLHGNTFVGSIPPSFGNLTRLTYLNLAKNEFEGPIPPMLGILTRLSSLDLSYNNLQGGIPPEISGLKQLRTLNLSYNRLNGEIPDDLSQCQGLITIQMDHNNLKGNIPTSLGDLVSLNMLSLSYNDLSGAIPVSLELVSKLDLSYNHLQGAIPTKGVFGNASAVSLDGNSGLCGGVSELHMPQCPVPSRRNKIRYYLIRVLIPFFGFLSLILLVYFLLLERNISRREYESEAPLGEHFPKVSYSDLVEATSSFSESNLLGKGSYGTVYRGKLVQNKMEVAVKVFNLEMPGAERSFMSECEALRSVQHRNLLSIITACSTVDSNGNPFRALIYEFMPKGNLDTWLHQNEDGQAPKHLGLTERIGIAVNIGDALDYLHNDSENPIIHCDLKPSNILLDDDMVAHLGDFGIARFFLDSRLRPEGSTSSIGVKGTIGYIPPEYAGGGRISTSGDVYSFGILLLEMLTGKRPTDPIFKEGLDIVNFVSGNFPHQIPDVIDVNLKEEFNELSEEGLLSEDPAFKSLVSLVQVAFSCTRQYPNERANMRETASKIQAIKASYIATKENKNSA